MPFAAEFPDRMWKCYLTIEQENGNPKLNGRVSNPGIKMLARTPLLTLPWKLMGLSFGVSSHSPQIDFQFCYNGYNFMYIEH